MDHVRIDPAIDEHPGLERAGWWAARVFELLIKVSGRKDFHGEIPLEYLDPVWLAKRWNLGASDIPGADPSALIETGLDALLAIPKKHAVVERRGDALVILGWEDIYGRRAKSNAERQAEYRERQAKERNENNGSNGGSLRVTRSHDEALTSTPHHTTPHNKPPPPSSAPAAALLPEKLDQEEAIACFDACQELRRKSGRAPDAMPARDKLGVWYDSLRNDFGDRARAAALSAYAAFLGEERFAQPRKAWAVFAKDAVWRQRVRLPPARARDPCAVPGCSRHAEERCGLWRGTGCREHHESWAREVQAASASGRPASGKLFDAWLAEAGRAEATTGPRPQRGSVL